MKKRAIAPMPAKAGGISRKSSIGLIVVCGLMTSIVGCGNTEAPNDQALETLFAANKVVFEEAADAFENARHWSIRRKPDGQIGVDNGPGNAMTTEKYGKLTNLLQVDLIRTLDAPNGERGTAFIYYSTGIVTSGGCSKGIVKLRDSAAMPQVLHLDPPCPVRTSADGIRSSSGAIAFKRVSADWHLFYETN